MEQLRSVRSDLLPLLLKWPWSSGSPVPKFDALKPKSYKDSYGNPSLLRVYATAALHNTRRDCGRSPTSPMPTARSPIYPTLQVLPQR